MYAHSHRFEYLCGMLPFGDITTFECTLSLKTNWDEVAFLLCGEPLCFHLYSDKFDVMLRGNSAGLWAIATHFHCVMFVADHDEIFPVSLITFQSE